VLIVKNNNYELNWATYAFVVTRSRFFYKLGRTSNKRFPNHRLSFWKEVMFYRELLSQNIYIKTHTKGVARGVGGKNIYGGHSLGSRVHSHPPLSVYRLNGMCIVKVKAKPFFVANRSMARNCPKCSSSSLSS
jgi:hypothetical protein